MTRPHAWAIRAAVLICFALASGGVRAAPNILVIIADDLGTESLAVYGIGEETAVTPNIDRLAERGVRFERFWSQPVCSPTRAAILTGRYAFRTGVRGPIQYLWSELDSPTPVSPAFATVELQYEPFGRADSGEAMVLSPRRGAVRPLGPARTELMLPAVLKTLPDRYATAAIGKWHLVDLLNGKLEHPNEAGFDDYSGGLFGAPTSFFAWRHVQNGRLTAESGYYDQRVNQDAIRWIADRGDEPWFLWLAYSNPHVPIHKPPRELLHSGARDLEPNPATDADNRAYFFAQVEAMDTLIGELLDSIAGDVLENTYVIFLGDNGTDRWADPPAPRDPLRAKGTVYEGGISVPLIVAGPGISGGRVTRPLAHAVDLFSTIIELAGADPASALPDGLDIDSISLVPTLLERGPQEQRGWLLSEGSLGPVTGTAVRDERYKLIRINDREELYDLTTDPNELDDLLPALSLDDGARSSYERLRTVIDQVAPAMPATPTTPTD